MIIGAVVGVTVLDGGPQRFRKRDRRIEVETVHRPSGAGALIALDGRAKQPVGKCLVPEVPRAQEVVFRAGPVDGRCRLTVNEEHIVALAPPAVGVLDDRHGDSHKMAASGGFHPDVVTLTVDVEGNYVWMEATGRGHLVGVTM